MTHLLTALLAALHDYSVDAALLLGIAGAALTTLALWSRE